MKSATLKICSTQGGKVGELEIEDVADGVSEAALRRHYDKLLRLFLRQFAAGSYVSEVVWK